MKKIYIIAGFLFLASCGNAEVQETRVIEAPATPEIVVEQEVEIEFEDDDQQDDEETSNEERDESDRQDQEATKPEDDDARVEEDREDESEEETPAEEINDEVAELETAVEDLSKTATIDAVYNNPKGLVDMKVNYSLGSDGKITTIGVSATTYKGLGDFNNGIQSLIGSTLEDAANYKSGSSLTGPAFQSAIKSQL